MQDGLGPTSEPRLGDDDVVGDRGVAILIDADDGEPSAAAANPTDPAGNARRWDLASRVLLVVAAVALLISPRFPYWNMKLNAPQYPRGLSLAIYPDHVEGDVDEIDGLNHYIGMRKIGSAAPIERRLGIPAIMMLAAGLLFAASIRSRWVVVLVIPAILFPPLFLGDLYWWLRDSGLGLDTKAPLSSSIKPFVPQVLGAGKIGQFRTEASLGLGYYLCLSASAVSVFFCYTRLRSGRARRPANAGQEARTAVLTAGTILGVLLLNKPLAAETLVVGPSGSTTTLSEALDRASDGDTIVVRGGVHPGPVVVRKSVHLIGEDRPVIDGGERGTVVQLEGRAAELRGFAIRSSGDVLAREDSGVLAAAPELRIEDNTFEDVLFGVNLRQAPRSMVRGNVLRGKALPVARRGDLIRLWYSDDVTVERNSTVGGRDVVLWYSKHLTIRDNRITEGRYGLHFMYCHDAGVVGNQLRGNSVGAFLMYSRRLQLRENWIVGNRGVSGYGIGLKDMDDSHVSANVLASNKVGIFLEHSTGAFEDNLLADNDKGLVIFTSARGNRFEANSFVENGEQVVVEGSAEIMTTNLWRGNFWSDYRGYDADGDGRGDLPYRPTKLFERLSDRNHGLRLFTDSPSARAIDFASRVFPIFEPKPKFTDESPRMRPYPAPISPAVPGGRSDWCVLGAVILFGPMLVGLAGPVAVRGTGHSRKSREGASRAADEISGTLSGDEDPSAISVRGLTKRFGKVTAVDAVSFEVRPGETVALWGPNGAGKTTILRCLLGLLPCEGTAQILGQPCGPRGRASRQRLGYVPQDVRLHADQSVRDTVRFYARLRRVGADRVDALLREWGLHEFQRRSVSQLSGGMRQKLALVVALLSDPPVLLLDEPTSNLDARTRREFGELLERLKAAGKTLLFCTHRPSEVWKLADRVIVLERGRKVAEGTPERIRDYLLEPAHLGLTVADGESDTAAERLRDGGFVVQTTGSRLWVEAPAGRKVEAINLLNRAGVRILDFDLEHEHENAGVPCRREA
jgi:nitrous oxidase accessory protein